MKVKVLLLAPQLEDGVRLPPDYPAAVQAAGGEPFVITQYEKTPVEELAERYNSLLLIGGSDIDPSVYGQPIHTLTKLDAPGRDCAELALYKAFRAKRKPILGICRGMQLINVAEGGTLIQHLPDMRWLSEQHSGQELRHDVLLAPSCGLRRIFRGETRLRVNSRHHQAIDRLAKGFSISAVSPEGLPEAIESDGVLALQWHPENLGASMLPIFQHFIAGLPNMR